MKKTNYLIFFVCPLVACFLSPFSTDSYAGEGFGGFLNDVMKGVADQKGMRGEYQSIAFYKTIDIEFQKDNLNRNLKTTAIFNKIENAPKSGPGVMGYINLRLCDPKMKDACDDLFLIDKGQFDQVYQLDHGAPIDIYGVIRPKQHFFGGHFYIVKFNKSSQARSK